MAALDLQLEEEAMVRPGNVAVVPYNRFPS